MKLSTDGRGRRPGDHPAGPELRESAMTPSPVSRASSRWIRSTWPAVILVQDPAGALTWSGAAVNPFSDTGSRSAKGVGLPVLWLLVTPLLAQNDAAPLQPTAGVQIDWSARDRDPRPRPGRPGQCPTGHALCLTMGLALPGSVPPEPGRSGRAAEPILGSYRVEGSTLRFTARYPLDQPGYQALIDETLLKPADRRHLAAGHRRCDWRLTSSLGSPAGTTARRLSPRFIPQRRAAGELAAVLHPLLGTDEPWRGLPPHSLARRSRQAGWDPFLELEQELWSGDGRRFTLLFDPGRIKRGLKPREEQGPSSSRGFSPRLIRPGSKQQRDRRPSPDQSSCSSSRNGSATRLPAASSKRMRR